MELFYKPHDGVLADVIPFYAEGKYHLFYLKDYREDVYHGQGTPWFHVATQDFVTFEDLGEAIPRGGANEQDLFIFTGCALEAEGAYHIFYTGHNPHFPQQGKPTQAVMHATSGDLVHWQKDTSASLLFADPDRYELDDWRDPFIFWNDQHGEYWMLLAARLKSGPSNRRGCIALVTSKDLVTWDIKDPFWAPDLYFTHECPDLFKIGDWWYLVYSTFSERSVTHYRMSKSLEGPWHAPANDTFDGRAFYAAKTVSDGERRFALGWNPSRSGSHDEGHWNWGGHLVVHEIVQSADGTLKVKPPAEIISQFSRTRAIEPRPVMGHWHVDNDTFHVDRSDAFSYCHIGGMPHECLLEATILPAEQTRGVGLILRADQTLDRYYQLRFEPAYGRLVLDRWPRRGDAPPIMERFLENPLREPLQLRILVKGSAVACYANDEIALTARIYNHSVGSFGLFATEGGAQFTDVAIRVRN